MPDEHWPRVSIVVPARNAGDSIGPTLQSILAQDYAGEFDVTIADGSDDGAMRDFVNGEFPDVSVVVNDRRTIPCGLNRALEATEGPVIARCDAHTVLPPDYLSRSVGMLEERSSEGVVNVGGRAVPVGSNPFGRAVARAVTSPLVSGNSRYKVGGAPGPVDTVYLGVFYREAWLRAGGYNEGLDANEDYELNWRFRRNGGTVWFDPSIQSTYLPRSSPESLARQNFTYGRWKAAMLLANPRSVRMRQLAPPLLLAVMMATVLASLLSGWLAGLALWPGIYVAMAAAEGLRKPDRWESCLLILPLVMFIMHVSWAAGFFVPKKIPKPSPQSIVDA